MATLATKPITIEEFENLPYATTARKELVRGEMIEKMSPGAQHGKIQALIAHYLTGWAIAHDAGSVGVEIGFVLAHEPSTIRLPDVSFVRAARYAGAGEPEGFWLFAPDLAVEVISPSESAEAVYGKIRDYLERVHLWCLPCGHADRRSSRKRPTACHAPMASAIRSSFPTYCPASPAR